MDEYKTIQLSRGKQTIVDAEDFGWLSKWKWYCDNRDYAQRDVVISQKSPRIVKKIPMHKEIMKVSGGREIIVDHKNRDRLDNRKQNLRLCTMQQNVMNVPIYKNKKSSRYKGVFRGKDSKKYKVMIGFNGKLIHIGVFESEMDGAKAYNEAALKYFGEFASLNEL